jgi:hypothetical protein
MSTVVEEIIIESATKDFLQKLNWFTSVDIANRIKLTGNWVRNSTVAEYLRRNALSLATKEGVDYKRTLIPVTLWDGGTSEAFLYHPEDEDPLEYVLSGYANQRALDPVSGEKEQKTALHIQALPDSVVGNPTVDLSAWIIPNHD